MASDGRDGAEVALVTGASRGVGLEVCRQLAGRGMTVYLTAPDGGKAGDAVRPLVEEGLDIRPLALDVADGESMGRAPSSRARGAGSTYS